MFNRTSLRKCFSFLYFFISSRTRTLVLNEICKWIWRLYWCDFVGRLSWLNKFELRVQFCFSRYRSRSLGCLPNSFTNVFQITCLFIACSSGILDAKQTFLATIPLSGCRDFQLLLCFHDLICKCGPGGFCPFASSWKEIVASPFCDSVVLVTWNPCFLLLSYINE